MNIFDKICAVGSFALGTLLLVLGIVGLFTGCKAHFSLPPILGVIPAFVGWGIVKPIVVAWNKPHKNVYRKPYSFELNQTNISEDNGHPAT